MDEAGLCDPEMSSALREFISAVNSDLEVEEISSDDETVYSYPAAEATTTGAEATAPGAEAIATGAEATAPGVDGPASGAYGPALPIAEGPTPTTTENEATAIVVDPDDPDDPEYARLVSTLTTDHDAYRSPVDIDSMDSMDDDSISE